MQYKNTTNDLLVIKVFMNNRNKTGLNYFFEYLFYKPIDHSWNPPREIKLNFYYYFCTDPPEHRKWIRLLYGLIQDGDMSFLLSKLFQLFLQ